MPRRSQLPGLKTTLSFALSVHVALCDTAHTSSGVQDSHASSSQESTAEGELQAPLFAVSICTEAMIRELLASSTVTQEEQEAIWIAFKEYKAIAQQCIREGNVALHEAGLADRAAIRDMAIYRDDTGRRRFRPSDDPIWAQWRELETNLNNCVVPPKRRHDAALRSMLDRINGVYEQGDIFIPQPRVFLLRLLSGKRRIRHYAYAMENVDLDEFVRQSLESGVLGELCEQLQRTQIDAYTAQQLLYELRHVLHAHNEQRQQELAARVMPAVQFVTEDMPGLVPSAITPDVIEAMSRSGRRWRARFDVNANTMQQIMSVVRESFDDHSLKRLEHEYNLALCPAIFQQRWPHTMTDWLRSNPKANDDLLAAAERVQQEFTARYDALQQSAFQAGVKACSRLGTTVVSFGEDVEAHARFDEGLLAMQFEGRRAIQQLHALLPPGLQTELRTLLASGDPTMAGPYRFSKYFTEQQKQDLSSWPGF